MTGLLIRFMVRCPRRQKEIREMDLDGRLYQDDFGTWQLHYQSHQLKIAMHDGQPNEFRMEWPADLVDDLTEYLEVFRPMILGPRPESTGLPHAPRHHHAPEISGDTSPYLAGLGCTNTSFRISSERSGVMPIWMRIREILKGPPRC